MDVKHCVSCYNNYYNQTLSDGCLMRKDAKLVWRIPIGNWERPPYLNKKKVRVPDCYHEDGSNKTHYVDPKAITTSGYWK